MQLPSTLAATGLLGGPASMPVHQFRIKLDRASRRRTLAVLIGLNLIFSALTTAFIFLWARMPELSPSAQWLTRYVLVQGHLATENVVAAWYSSMLLLTVACLSLVAWAVGRREGRLNAGWLIFAAIFVVLSLDEIGSLHERIGMLPLADGRAVGWTYILAIPIGAVAAFLTAFAWFHLRRVHVTMMLMVAGVLMFVMDPVLERIEMAMIHGAGAVQGTWQRSLHDTLLVVEEGGLELFGILCFLGAVMAYVARRSSGTVEWSIGSRTTLLISRACSVLLACGPFVAGALVARLPSGDTGIAENWFPATAWMLVAFAAVTGSVPARGKRVVASSAVILSAICGAGLYGYVGWLASRAAWVNPVAAVMTAGLALEALLNPYLFRRSPRSSIASPTLRRPRPNPS